MKFAASLVCPVSAPPLRNAVVEVDENGTIVSVSEGSASFSEIAGVAFYSGILIPGLSDMMCGSESADWLLSRGVRIAGSLNMQERAGSTVSWKGRYGGRVDFIVYREKEFFDRQFMPDKHKGLFRFTGNGKILQVLASYGQMEMIQLMYELQQIAMIGFFDVLAMASLNGAMALGVDDFAGSIRQGRQPGLNIIEGADMNNLKLLPSSRLRRLI